jgi:hypothetical protein
MSRIFRLEDEDRFRHADPRGDGLHHLAVKAIGVRDYSERISPVHTIREDVQMMIKPFH